MDILDKLHINQERKGILIAIGSKATFGKTSVLIAIAKCLMKEGKKIAVISDDNVKVWFRRIVDFNTHGRLTFFNGTLEVLDMIDKEQYDVVFIDSSKFSGEETIVRVREFAVTKNTTTFITYQLPRLYTDEMQPVFSNKKIYEVTDYLITIFKEKTSLSFWNKVKCILFPFWFPEPNIKVNIIKNRFDAPSSFHVSMDFQTATLR